MVQERQTELTKKGESLLAMLKEVEPGVQEAQAGAEGLAAEAGQIASDDMKVRLGWLETKTGVTRVDLEKVQQGVQSLSAEVAEVPELVDPMRPALTRLSSLAEMYDLRLKQAAE